MRLRTRSTPYTVNTGWGYVEVTRYPEVTYQNGRPVVGPSQTLQVLMNVQGMFRYTSTVNAPDGQRHKSGVKVFATTQLRPVKEGAADLGNPDSFIWEGEEYIVWECVPWTGGIMNHWEVVALKRADL